MRAILFSIVMLITFFGFYFFINLLASPIFDSFTEINKNINWFIVYTLFIGWWTAIVCAHYVDKEYYK